MDVFNELDSSEILLLEDCNKGGLWLQESKSPLEFTTCIFEWLVPAAFCKVKELKTRKPHYDTARPIATSICPGAEYE